MQAAADPESPALGELYEQYADKVFRFIYSRVGRDTAAAEDINGDVWERVARAIPTYTSHGEGSFPAWVFTIARRQIASHWRGRGRRREQVTADMLALDAPSLDLSPHDSAVLHEQAEMIATELRQLNKAQRECVVLRFFNGLTVAETAKVMGKSQGAVKVMQHRALKELAQVMTRPERNPMYASGVSTATTAGRR